MPQQPGRPNQPPGPESRLLGELIGGIARSLCLSVEAFCHTRFGSGYVGCGPMGLIVLWAFAAAFPADDLRPLLGYEAAFAVAWLVAVAGVLRRRWRRGEVPHRKYSGRPILMGLLRGWREPNVKHAEALAVVLAGWAVHLANRPLGDYLLLAGSLVFLRNWALVAERRHQAAEMHDHALEQREVADLFGDMQRP
jgi:hypothetical protein